MDKPISLLYVVPCLFFVALPGKAQPTLDPEQSSFLTLINNYRTQNGVGPLQVSIALQNSSQWMSADMATKSYFSHTDSLGRDPFTRMIAFGYSHQTYEGENIAAGYSDAQNTLVQWQTACDPDASGACTYAHKQNMLNAAYKVIGIGRAYNAAAPYRWYWTTDFGGFLDQALGTTPPTTAPPTINSFTASPTTVSAGQSVTLSWNVSGATSLAIDNGIGNVTGTSKSVTPTATAKYTLTATSAGGTKTATVTVTVTTVTPPPQTTSLSIWPSTSQPSMYINGGGPLEVGLKFRSDVAGRITGIRFYKIGTNTGTHTGSLWSSTGSLLATGTFVNETASGWQTLTFATPVPIWAATTYVASYHTSTGLPAVGVDLQRQGKDTPPLHALQSGIDGFNGVYIFGQGGVFPSQGTSGYNFWVDVTFMQ